MYERSAIVLERYFEKVFGITKENNIKTNYENYTQIIEEIKEYQRTIEEEERVINKFDEVATEIEEIQNRQSKLYEANLELENQRNKLFNDLAENPNTLDNRLQKLEEKLENNNEELKELRERYVKSIVIFTERQKERNKYARARRTVETNHMNNIDNSKKMFETIEKKDIEVIQEFIKFDKDKIKQEIVNIMIKNGKSERVPFNDKVIERAVGARLDIAQKEAELYIIIYDRTKKILNELENENIKLARAEKLVRDASVKWAFLNASKEYIVGFLDNERMTAINGKKTHEKLMEEACQNFDKDLTQIKNLYELLLKETTGKSTKKAYKELYNKNYLREIEEREKDFEEEVTNIKINIGTVINSNYWRIEEIKNIYKVFQEEITEKFNKDLSEFRVEEIENIILPGNELDTSLEDDYENEENINNNEEYYNDDDDEDKYYDDDDEDEYYNDGDENEYQDDDDEDEDEYYYDDEDEYDDDNEDEYDDDDDEYEYYDDDDEYEDEDEYYDDEEDEYDEHEENNDEELTEDNLDEIIKNSRKKVKGKNKDNKTKGLLGKLFNK